MLYDQHGQPVRVGNRLGFIATQPTSPAERDRKPTVELVSSIHLDEEPQDDE